MNVNNTLISYNMDNNYYLSSNSNSIGTILYGSDLIMGYKDGSSFSICLHDSANNSLVGKNVIIGVNGRNYTRITNVSGYASLPIGLPVGNYTVIYSFVDSNYISSSNSSLISVNIPKYNAIYNLSIPLYANVTMPFVTSICPSEYVVEYGYEGIVKLPFSRFVDLNIGNELFTFTVGLRHSLDVLHLQENQLYFIPLYNARVLFIDSIEDINEPGFLLFNTGDYLNVSYFMHLNKNVNQFSALYKPTIDETEVVKFVLNSIVSAELLFSTSIPGFDETGIRYQLANQYNYFNDDFLTCEYDKICGVNGFNLNYTRTGDKVGLNIWGKRIVYGPKFDELITGFTVDNQSVIKTEEISYGNGIYYLSSNGFEVVQSFAIAKFKVNNNILSDYLAKNTSFPVGGMKAAYGTFLTALTTIFLSDKLADEEKSKYNVSWIRDKNTVVMSGVSRKGMSYLHCLDPGMGRDIMGNNETNVCGFRFICSMALSELERAVLSFSGNNASSTFSSMMLKIINGSYFSYYDDGDLTIIKMRDSGEKIIINNTNGLVYAFNEINNFKYKGAMSNNISFCYHSNLTDNLVNIISCTATIYNSSKNLINNINFNISLSENDWDKLYGVIGDFAFSGAAAMIYLIVATASTGVGIELSLIPAVVAGTLMFVGFNFKLLSNDMDEHANWETFNRTKADSFTSLATSMATG